MKKSALLAGMALAAGLGYLLAWPIDLDPIAWQAPAYAPSAWSPTVAFEAARRIAIMDGAGPEDVDVDPAGRVYAGLEDGRIVRWGSLEAAPVTVADTGGRPLGLHWDSQGRLLIADSDKGLLRMTPEGQIETLATECGGTELVFTDDLETLQDGTVYFSDASVRYRREDWKRDLLESRPHGRLCRWREGMAEAEQVLDGLHFANGIAIDPDERFVLVNETSRYRVIRLWLGGEREGQHEVLIDNLPGFPDGVSTGTRGVFWIAIASPRNPLIDRLAPQPFFRRVIQRLPSFLHPAPEKTSRAIGIDARGRVVHDLWDPTGEKIAMVTSVQERNGNLYFGSLTDGAFAVLPAPQAIEAAPDTTPTR